MFKIEFYLEDEQSNWSESIHQLNSDILRRHIFPKLHSKLHNLEFTFSESNMMGDILSDIGFNLGTFKIY
ncbi:hypothetical protein DI392_06295 [Vibrio albus]|jgi:hypothetical protein|uniref:Uncharacterized protein n=1 Tax=Vibrio albus TaxID=2200953 RepID=A0A2U3BAJ4_9VIBR|nr:hypothetical protein DI392_06295 [Vibrio albus]